MTLDLPGALDQFLAALGRLANPAQELGPDYDQGDIQYIDGTELYTGNGIPDVAEFALLDTSLWRGFQTTPLSSDRRSPLSFAVHPPRAGVGNPCGIRLSSAQSASGNSVNITKMVRRRGDLREMGTLPIFCLDKCPWRRYVGVMPRAARMVVPGVPYHITQRGNRREDVFFCDGDRNLYLKLLLEHASPFLPIKCRA